MNAVPVSRLRLVLVAVLAAACGRSDSLPSGPIPLEFVREIARPTNDPSTDWLGRTRELTYDRWSEHLIGVNIDQVNVFEATLDGEFVRSYGQFGEGPGELKNPLGLIPTARGVVVIDLGNMKLSTFPRNGALPTETRLDHYYYRFAPGPGAGLFALPGWEGEAFVVMDSLAVTTERLGRREDLPPGSCTHCMLAALQSGALLVVDPDLPGLLLFSRDGTIQRRLPLDGLEVLRRWEEEAAAVLASRPDIMGGGHRWIGDVEVVDDSTVLLAVAPARAFERGMELWKVDLSQETVTRYRYDHVQAGAEIAVRWPSVYTILIRDAAIMEYRLPTPDTP